LNFRHLPDCGNSGAQNVHDIGRYVVVKRHDAERLGDALPGSGTRDPAANIDARNVYIGSLQELQYLFGIRIIIIITVDGFGTKLYIPVEQHQVYLDCGR
jgi:hypothetical protein